MRLVVENLSKEYRGGGQVVQALSKVQIALRPGVLGLLGPNGAGKSTLMRILATITQPSSGRVLWNDVEIAHHPDPLRTVLGYLPQDFGVYPNLNALEFLEYLAAVKGIQTATVRKRIGELLELVNLTEVAKRPLGGYSGGMRQRIGIAQALLNDPQLLIVDEPTAGLDPEERVRFRNLLSELSGERIVILSTHIVSDVEAVASSIAILAHGHLIAHDVPEALLASVAGKVWQVVVPSSELYALRQKHLVSSTAHRSDGVHARVVADAAPENAARPLDPVLEDAYLSAVAQPGHHCLGYCARGLPRAHSPSELFVDLGLCALSGLSGDSRQTYAAGGTHAGDFQFRMGRWTVVARSECVHFACGLLFREEHHPARPRHARGTDSRGHSDLEIHLRSWENGK